MSNRSNQESNPDQCKCDVNFVRFCSNPLRQYVLKSTAWVLLDDLNQAVTSGEQGRCPQIR
jgi:hypothetical protein